MPRARGRPRNRVKCSCRRGVRRQRGDAAGGGGPRSVRPAARRPGLSSTIERVAAVFGVPARPGRGRPRPQLGRGACEVSLGDAAGGRPDSGCARCGTGSGTVWRTGLGSPTRLSGPRSARPRCRSRPLSGAELPSFGRVTKAEKGIIWWLMSEPEGALAVLKGLDLADFDGLASRSVLDLARKLNEDRGFSPSALLERLSVSEAQLVRTIASEPEPPTLELHFCVREIQRTPLRARAHGIAAGDRSPSEQRRVEQSRDERAAGS